ncbi:hypothetical protein F7725_024314 [Dissostichus mawsoni]|uniref:Heparan-alpha-glucosaminide N-acetyltransferase n=1 Tax=Dissostichus mawsoni TaxID=36200 RepID=A0A7J5XZY6_DISMA|nr:hypothetical protein F7725_024314 [Dissostichus mawsoni]
MEPRTLQASLTLLILVTSSYGGHLKSGPTLKMDQALLIFHNQLAEEVQVFYTSDHCYKCLYQHLVTVKPNNNNASVVISTKFTLTMHVDSQSRNATLCRWSQTYGEGGHYSVWIQMSESARCTDAVDKIPNNVYLPLLVAALLLGVIALLFAVAPYIFRRRCPSECIKPICCQGSQYSVDNDEAQACEVEEENTTKAKPTRLHSLDTFRGFVFIIGTSVVLALRSMQRKGVSRLELLRKITWRTVVLLMLGFCFLNYSSRDGPRTACMRDHDVDCVAVSWSWLRIPGVLQRLGFTYFWLIIVLLETLWLCITLLLPVPNCPTGYLGAGGIGDDGLYPNCTGGAAGYIDRWMFGDNMYRYPTCKELYRSTQPFDPEGVLGTINSVVIGFLGMQAGKIIIFYRGINVHILCRFLVWAVILYSEMLQEIVCRTGLVSMSLHAVEGDILKRRSCLHSGGGSSFQASNHRIDIMHRRESLQPSFLSAREMEDLYLSIKTFGKSLSFVLCMGSVSFLLLGGMYYVTDIKGWWGGQPFIYPGMNSIFVYVGHSLLGFYFPFSWEMSFQESHWEQLFQSLWGTALWVLIAYLLYRKKFFLKI